MKRNKTSIMMALAALLMGGQAAAQSSDAQLPEFIANLVYETDINNSLDNLRGIYKFKPAQTIQLDTVYVSTMMNANGGGVFRNDLFQFINYYDPGRGRYANDSEFELVLTRAYSVELFGLRICRQAVVDGRYRYALILSDGSHTSGTVLIE